MKAKVLVEIRSGVAYVTTDSKVIEIIIIDYDVQGFQSSHEVKHFDNVGKERADFTPVNNVNRAYVDHYFKIAKGVI